MGSMGWTTNIQRVAVNSPRATQLHHRARLNDPNLAVIGTHCRLPPPGWEAGCAQLWASTIRIAHAAKCSGGICCFPRWLREALIHHFWSFVEDMYPLWPVPSHHFVSVVACHTSNSAMGVKTKLSNIWNCEKRNRHAWIPLPWVTTWNRLATYVYKYIHIHKYTHIITYIYIYIVSIYTFIYIYIYV